MILSWALDHDLRVQEKIGSSSPWLRRWRGPGGSGVNGETTPVVLEIDDATYEVRLGQARSNAWSVASISSRNGGEVRLEMGTASVRFGRRRRHGFAVSLDKGRALE
jgi:hypothetical protein